MTALGGGLAPTAGARLLNMIPILTERLLIVAPEQTRRRAVDAVDAFVAGDVTLLSYHFMLSRRELRACGGRTLDERIASLNALLDRMGGPS